MSVCILYGIGIVLELCDESLFVGVKPIKNFNPEFLKLAIDCTRALKYTRSTTIAMPSGCQS